MTSDTIWFIFNVKYCWNNTCIIVLTSYRALITWNISFSFPLSPQCSSSAASSVFFDSLWWALCFSHCMPIFVGFPRTPRPVVSLALHQKKWGETGPKKNFTHDFSGASPCLLLIAADIGRDCVLSTQTQTKKPVVRLVFPASSIAGFGLSSSRNLAETDWSHFWKCRGLAKGYQLVWSDCKSPNKNFGHRPIMAIFLMRPSTVLQFLRFLFLAFSCYLLYVASFLLLIYPPQHFFGRFQWRCSRLSLAGCYLHKRCVALRRWPWSAGHRPTFVTQTSKNRELSPLTFFF